MKSNRSNFITRCAMACGVVLGFIVYPSSVPTLAFDRTDQMQMGDMPYDLHYIEMMVVHYQEGIELAQLAESKAENARVKAFAQKTATDQQNDIDALQGLRNKWYAGKAPMDPAMMSSMMHGMHPGMMSMDETRRKLRATDGAAFDRLFLDTMIQHHQMAVEMSREATTKAEHTEIKELARKAVLKQQAQLAEMNTLKGGGTSRPTRAKPKTKAMPHMTHSH